MTICFSSLPPERNVRVLLLLCLAISSCAVGSSETWELETRLPDHPAKAETYLCTRVDLSQRKSEPLQIIGIEPLSSEKLVHHMLLFGCEKGGQSGGVWSCQGHSVCPGGGNQQILYGWAKGAPAMHLPPGVSYKIGAGTKISSLVLQVHYAVERPAGDVSGIRLSFSNAHLPFSAGMQMYSSNFEIPPGVSSHLVSSQCCYRGFEPAHGFAFRVHTHVLGKSVYLDDVSPNGTLTRLVEHSPQLPQGFNPVSNLTFWPGQKLQATCDFDSTGRDDITYAGATHHNEMCNLYMIMWSQLPVFWGCHNNWLAADLHGAGGIPSAGKLEEELPEFWQVPASRTESQPQPAQPFLGQVSGVAKGLNGTIWVLHRGSRVWDALSFTGSRLQHTSYTDAISEDVVFQLDEDTGRIVSQFGANQYFMPHMITVDNYGNLWITDVALHQVFKLDPEGNVLLTLGTRLKPGTGALFCKPTQVAVARDGTIYVSDGYCNSRVASFSASGEFIGEFVLEEGSMNVPHSLLLDECGGFLLVADREHARVRRFQLDTKKESGSWELSKHGLVYGITMGPYGSVFAICWKRQTGNGPSSLVRLHDKPEKGVAHAWQLPGIQAPHDIALLAAPLRLAQMERPVAILIAETRTWGSRLMKYVLLPDESPSLQELSQEALKAASSQGHNTSDLAALTPSPLQWQELVDRGKQSNTSSRFVGIQSAGHNSGLYVIVLLCLLALGWSYRSSIGSQLSSRWRSKVELKDIG